LAPEHDLNGNVEIKRIQKLSDPLANQIAAGEVVERAGSALKELMENSLDADAKSIRVKWESAGASLLEVADDGHGIHAEDLHLALDRHATSKISSTEDLFAIQTWGFRGEALASIGAVSRLTLNSRREGSQMGNEIFCEGGWIKEEKPVARPVGTTVRIEDLFFNTPARKKFLKSASAETTYCLQNFHRLALSSPKTAFEFSSDGETLFHYPALETTAERVADVYRKAWRLSIEAKDLMEVKAESNPLKLQAWILPSKHHIPTSRGILLYVNKRSVKDKLLQQAVIAAAKETLFGNLYPQLVLNLELPADAVDVNVHPTKAEVRFREGGHVFAFLRKHLEKALASERPSGLFASPQGQTFSNSEHPETHANLLFSSATQYQQKAPPEISNFEQATNWIAEGIFEKDTNQTHGNSYPSPTDAPYQGPQFLGNLKNTYLVCQDAEGLLLVDQHAAHERVTYEKLKKTRLSKQEGAPLLIPIQVEMGREQLDRLENELPKFAELGLILDRTGPTLLAVREIPAILLKKDGSPVISIGNFLRKIVQGWEEISVTGELADQLREKILDVLASESCHGSVRAGKSLSPQEAMALLQQMQTTDFAGHCPHGRPTTVRFRWTDIERLFKRIQ
jgi:DNA mismatch repair protein MutL